MTYRLPFIFKSRTLNSKVYGHEGDCIPVWVNRNVVCNSADGGIAGFFRQAKTIIPGFLYQLKGEEFHGIIRSYLDEDGSSSWNVYSTAINS